VEMLEEAEADMGNPPGRSRKPKGVGGTYLRKTSWGEVIRYNKKMADSVDKGKVEELDMTYAQCEVYMCVVVFWEEYKFAPSLANIAMMREKKGLGNTKRIVDSLVELGALKYMPGKKRTVRPTWMNFRDLLKLQ
jgi:sulfur relay (sulfurtransferase) DsrC/TusE family protein